MKNQILKQNHNKTIIDVSTKKCPNLACVIDTASCSIIDNGRKWGARKDKRGRISVSQNLLNGRGTIEIHRFILDAPADKLVFHINGDTLDNRLSNLSLSSRIKTEKHPFIQCLSNLVDFKKRHITHSSLITNFRYNPLSGYFYRIKPTGVEIKVGSKSKDGYLMVNILDRSYSIHRLAWFYMTGSIPNGLIDHKDGNRLNNRFDNLRVVSASENQENQKLPRPYNTTGYLGVTVIPSGKDGRKNTRYRAKIVVHGDEISIGVYDTPEEAHRAYVESKRKLHKGNTL